MDGAAARRLHAKIRRRRTEPGYGWLDAWQLVEETAAVAGDKGDFNNNTHAFAAFLDGCAPASARAYRTGTRSTREALDRVRLARNGAVHRGSAGARLRAEAEGLLRLTEEALAMSASDRTIGFYMTRGLVEAALGETLASARDTMLRYDFSALPVLAEENGLRWLTASELARLTVEGADMTTPVGEIYANLPRASLVKDTEPVSSLLRKLRNEEAGTPLWLVYEDDNMKARPVGIVTPADLLYAAPLAKKGWRRLSESTPSLKRVQFPGGKVEQVTDWCKVCELAVQWLWQEGKTEDVILPIKDGSGKPLLAKEADLIKAEEGDPVKVGDKLWINRAADGSEATKIILKSCGVDPEEVRFE